MDIVVLILFVVFMIFLFLGIRKVEVKKEREEEKKKREEELAARRNAEIESLESRIIFSLSILENLVKEGDQLIKETVSLYSKDELPSILAAAYAELSKVKAANKEYVVMRHMYDKFQNLIAHYEKLKIPQLKEAYTTKLCEEIAQLIDEADAEISKAIHEWHYVRAKYDKCYAKLDTIYKNKCQFLEQIKATNLRLVQVDPSLDKGNDIATAENATLSKIKRIMDKYKAFGDHAAALPASQMMDLANYGKVHSAFLDPVRGMQRADVSRYISRCEEIAEQGNPMELVSVSVERLLQCVWFLGMEKTFSAAEFRHAVRVFWRFYPNRDVDTVLAEYYAKMQVGSEDALREPIRELLKDNRERDFVFLSTLASGLMWMKAYQSEQTVLQYMLSNGLHMTSKMQERLHALSSNGGKAPSGYDVVSTEKSFYFDVSALAWKDEEYTGLFDNLAFQDKALTYALAVRDEDKELMVALGVRMPTSAALAEKFNAVFAEEYGPGVKAQMQQCIALSGNGEEPMEGVLVTSEECPQLGVMIHLGKIGKKLIIKFYTLFIPSGTDLAAQKQQALSMHKKLSPIIAMWESGLKDTMLLAVQQLLNSAGQTSSGAAADTTVF